MTSADLVEEIRLLVDTPQLEQGVETYTYVPEELYPRIRSAIRTLRALGVTLLFDMDREGVFDTEPSEQQGMLLALWVASELLRNDLASKVLNGELGLYYRAGPDILDTRRAAMEFKDVAKSYDSRLRSLLTVVLTRQVAATQSVFGDDTLTR